MMTFEELLETVGRLSPEQMDMLRTELDRLQAPVARSQEDIQQHTSAFHKATADFFAGFTEAQVVEIVADMNRERVGEDDGDLFDWIDHLPEDAR